MKVFVAVVVIAALCAVLITAASDEEKKGWTNELEGQKEGIAAAVARLTKLKVTWVEEVDKNLSSLQSSSIQEILHTFYQTFQTITLIAEGKNAADCIASASNSFIQYLSGAAAALNEIRKTALDSTEIQKAIDNTIQYSRSIIGQFDNILGNLDCLGYEADEEDSSHCYDIQQSYHEYDQSTRSFYDEEKRMNLLIEDESAKAYSTASKANAKTVETAYEKARSVKDTAAECIASL